MNVNFNTTLQSEKLYQLAFGKKERKNSDPLAIICDVYNKKPAEQALELYPVKDWPSSCNHGFFVASVAQAVCPQAEIKTFDFALDSDCSEIDNLKRRSIQMTSVLQEAIRQKKARPDRPVSVNFSVIFDVTSNQEAKQFAHGQNLRQIKDDMRTQKYGWLKEARDLYDTMKEFLSYPATNIYVAAGNSPDDLNMLLLADSNQVHGVSGSDANGVRLPFLAFNDLTDKSAQGLYNVYEDKEGIQFLRINGQRVEMFDGFKVSPEFEMDRVKAILGNDLKGRHINEVNQRLMSVKNLITNSEEEFERLPQHKKEYLLSKQHLYIPVGWGIDSLEGYHLQKHGLFFGIDEQGITYWSPDGSEHQKGDKVVGFINGTSFASPNAMMSDFNKILPPLNAVSFTGCVKSHSKRPVNKVNINALAYSRLAGSMAG